MFEVVAIRTAVGVAASLVLAVGLGAPVAADTTTTTSTTSTRPVAPTTTSAATSTTLLPPDEQSPVEPPAAPPPEISPVGADGTNGRVDPGELASINPTGDNMPIAGLPPRGLVASLAASRPLERRVALAMLLQRTTGANLRTALDTLVQRSLAEADATARLTALSSDQRATAERAVATRARLRRLAAGALSTGNSRVSAVLSARNPSEARERLTSIESISHAAARAARELEAARSRLSGEARLATDALAAATDERENAQAILTAAVTNHADASRALDDARVAAGVGPSAVPGISNRMLVAYLRAAQWSATVAPECRMTWWVLAAIGRVESGHARSVAIGEDGSTSPHIIGIALDGSNGTAVIGDSDGGAFDDDPSFDRAVGPMQFIPTTWASSGVDASGDGVADPHNVYDATFAAARYLCAGAHGLPVDTEAGFRAAAFSYNHSAAYVSNVWDGSAPYREIATAG